jgi:hypothetical protein
MDDEEAHTVLARESAFGQEGGERPTEVPTGGCCTGCTNGAYDIGVESAGDGGVCTSTDDDATPDLFFLRRYCSNPKMATSNDPKARTTEKTPKVVVGRASGSWPLVSAPGVVVL